MAGVKAGVKAPVQIVTLEAETELRFELESKNEKVTLVLKSGLAEVFGTELVIGNKYVFTSCAKIAVYTWHGCTVQLVGKTDVSYIGKETPMSLYLNCHGALETMRETAKREETKGPTVMVVGPNNVGKSTLCRILSNYAARMGRRPIYVDLDVDQGHIAIPGSIGALLVERPSDVVDGFSQKAPLVFHFGHNNPSANPVLYDRLVTRLAGMCSDRLQVSKRTNASGIVINTWGYGENSYQMLTQAAETFQVDSILVLDHEKLFHALKKDIPKSTKILHLPKSGGVVANYTMERFEANIQSIRKYFYGSSVRLYPHSFEVKWRNVKIFKIEAPKLPSSCTPLEMKAEDNLTKLVPVMPADNLRYHILSVSFADSPEDVVKTNLAGFVCITKVNVHKKSFTMLSPQPKLLGKHILLLSDFKFYDS